MKIDCVIPTRGDRPEFVDFVVKQMENQTLKPDFIEIVDHIPDNTKVDLASRYEIGINRRLNAGADVIFFIEDDDFYRKNYIETMVKLWLAADKPTLFGVRTTIYYHLGVRMAGYMDHEGRSSMFCSMISKSFDMSIWPKDPDPFVDLKIWKQAKSKKATDVLDDICIGIKHGRGKCGGSMHDPHRFQKAFKRNGLPDPDLKYLQEITGPGFWFYKSIINQESKK